MPAAARRQLDTTEDSVLSEGMRALEALLEDSELSRLFSLRSAVSTASSSALFHQAQQDVEVKYERIGFG